ncbi:MAG: hypothetical protein IJS31_03370, partial [Oscillospiraceae bacterium]|nr:hypothetical protein [Oscillospiraceae bacterium]
MILVKKYSPEAYPTYDNYDAINVDVTADIPYDYVPCWFDCEKADVCEWAKAEGMKKDAPAPCDSARTGTMGVPITFMDRYNPEQFDIIKFRKGNDEKDLTYTIRADDNFDRQTDSQTDR